MLLVVNKLQNRYEKRAVNCVHVLTPWPEIQYWRAGNNKCKTRQLCWFSQHHSRMPHSFRGCAPRGLWPPHLN